jgi:hypothetical protein
MCYACQNRNGLVKGDSKMTDWKTLKEVAEELGVSKDLVKYHRKNLDIFQIEKENGVYYISPSGVEKIRSRLRKESYDATFEEKITRRLHMIEHQQELMYKLLLEVLNGRK